MRLKSLEMQGFKSFPDKTKLSFEKGVTIVVGPNGSGKSNISDAIRWVLGELSSKNIRGNKMEDVIFGGTDSRRPMGFAEVTLTFDNTEGYSALPLDYDEVSITRRYYRTGESEYMINHKPVRHKDILELFMNTGLGKSGYSIIGQGRISEIISKKSEDRRAIFEEAAGISKYRYKKTEAERKIEEVELNLSRVTDILSELEGRVGPLEKESEKAKRYLELYEQKKGLDIALWLFDIDNIKNQTESLQKKFEIAKHDLYMADDSVASLESQSERLFSEAEENKIRTEQIRGKINALNEERHETESKNLLIHNNLEHIKTEIIRLNTEIESKEKEKCNFETNISKFSEKLETEMQTLDELTGKLNAVNGNLDNIRNELYNNENQKNELELKLKEKTDTLIETKISLSSLEGTKYSTSERKEELTKTSKEINERIKKLGSELLECGKTVSEYNDKIKANKEQLNNIYQKSAELRKKGELYTKEINDIKVEQSSVSQRILTLRKMEEHFDGYSASIKFIMERAKNGSLKGICGPVSKLVSVEQKYSVAIETALGANIQNIVVEDEECAKKAITALKINNAGRATFYPISTMRGGKPSLDEGLLARQEGYVGLASELVKCDSKYRGIVDYLLYGTIVCDNIDSASAIAKMQNYRNRIVTLDGQVINSGGSFTGGSVKRDSGILTRANEISKLEDKSISLNKKLSSLQADFDKVKKEIDSLSNEKDSLVEKGEIFSAMLNSEVTRQKIAQSQLENEEKQLVSINEQLSSLSMQDSGFEEKKGQLQSEIQTLENEIEAIKIKIKSHSEKASAITLRIDSIINEKNRLIVEITSKNKDIESTRLSLSQNEEGVKLAETLIDSMRQKLFVTSTTQVSSSETVEENKIKLETLKQSISALEKEMSEIHTKTLEFDKKISDIRLQIKDKTHHRENIFRIYTKLESELGQINFEQDKYTSKLWDEYELTYSDAKAQQSIEVTEQTKSKLTTEQTRLKNRIKELGNVNVGAIEEYKEVKERFDFLSKQYTDLTTSKEDLGNIIYKLEKEMRQRFIAVFAEINEHFKTVFTELFRGGTAELSLTDPDNVLESGIEISVAPPGKIIKNLMLLSGGEQVFVAIALFFAILKVNPAPFCLLDEIESALDEVNVSRFAEYTKRFSDNTQFIIITHRRGTMEVSDSLYGVTMQERGVSKLISLNVSEVEKKLGVKL